MSQLNHILSKRQPGSIFKPFVYAAAMNTGVTAGAPVVMTPATRVMDEPTTFWFDDKPYEPNNFTKKFLGEITLREAMAHSINIPTVKVAEIVGYDTVVDLAKNAGMNLNVQPTPSVALGAYEVTPVEMAGAYTVFANEGKYVKPSWISMVRSRNNETIYKHKPETHQVLDPRVAYMMVNLLEEVTRSGTAAGIRSRGFRAPAAGKTGTSTRRLVRRLHLRADLRRLGRIRRQSRAESRRRQVRPADLDRIHEARPGVQRVQERQAVRRARRHCDHGRRSAERTAGHRSLSIEAPGSVHRRAHSRSIAAVCTAAVSPVLRM